MNELNQQIISDATELVKIAKRQIRDVETTILTDDERVALLHFEANLAAAIDLINQKFIRK